ncbi:BofC C-terminal domain-containing protein [Niallia sp. 01092]|uniref:BofC C-terminal domain-containing protein n=1 Tax=unclassified Niallia TaxID=2837522 RepID=UPI003FD40E38
MKTRFLLISTVFLFLLLTSFLTFENKPSYANKMHEGDEHPTRIDVVLKRIYLDGEISEESLEETVWSMKDFLSKYDKWQIEKMGKNKLVFTKEVDDISPLLKTNGYFGISDEGILTIYNGKPEYSHIIQSFFQIDLKKLESNEQKNLQKGIRIKTKDQYVEVLETFKQYTTDNKAN